MLRIGSFVWGVRDLERAMEFWSAALGFVPREAPEDDWVVLVPPDRGPIQFALMVVTSDAARRATISTSTPTTVRRRPNG